MIEWLPIEEVREEIVGACRQGNRVAICAPTGSGKSTRVPQMLLDAGLAGEHGQVVVLQPRRIAARMLAVRVAQERGCSLGEEVGYRVRMESRAGRNTRIVYETEGVLLRRLAENRRLDGVAAVVFDEFHERHVYGDVTLSECRRLQEAAGEAGRSDLRLVVMSATLETGLVEGFLPGCRVVEGQGRSYPVEVRQLGTLQGLKPWDGAVAAIEGALREGIGEEGTTLVFMPGAYEIGRTVEALRRSGAGRGAEIVPLHGELPAEAQDLAVGRGSGRRRIVVATNVAETSLTIPEVRLVVDSGLARVARHDPYRGIDTLMVEPISKASAEQRTGRAGRTGPGTCLRLWGTDDQRGRPAHETPEILRIDPAEILLTLACLGVTDFRVYPWLEVPGEKALARAEGLLHDLGALGPENEITELGRRMAAFPVHPRNARMLIAAGEEEARGAKGAVREVALLCALGQGRPVLLRRVDDRTERYRADVLGSGGGSDLTFAARAWRRAAAARFDLETCQRLGIHAGAARAAGLLARRFLAIAAGQGVTGGGGQEKGDSSEGFSVKSQEGEGGEVSGEVLARCLLSAFSDRVARRLDAGTRRCELSWGRKAELDRDSLAGKASLLVATEVAEIGTGEGEATTRITQATAIKEEWLEEMFADEVWDDVRAAWDEGAGRAVGERRKVFRGLALSVRPCEVPRAEGEELLAEAVGRQDALPFKRWDRSVESWIARTNLVSKAWPEAEVPAYDESARELIVGQLCAGHVALRELKDVPVLGTVRAYLSAAQQASVERAAPERVTLENGRSVKVNYVDGGEPYVAVRIQELYGTNTAPKVVLGRVGLVVHVLAPSQRPVQITRDLEGFWREHYPRIRSELARKYPKHEWR